MSFRPLLVLAPLAAMFGWAASAGGCSATDTNTFDTTSTGSDTGSGSGSGGAGGTGTNSGGSSNDGGGGGLNFGGSNGQGGFNEDASCASTSADAELIPLDMILLLDQSGSMSSSNKWTNVVNAVNTFVNDPASAGISVGLNYFPAPVDSCNYVTYQTLDVAIGELPMNAPAISASLAAHGPTGLTPMYPALRGVLFTATAHQDANPTRKVIVVLATDGDPGGCSGDTIPNVAMVAQQALNYNGVQTYVIGITGATVTNLNQIAMAGGTGQAYDVTSDVTAFAAKMNEIRTSALACEFLIPEPPQGEMLDIAKVAVKFTDDNGISVQIPKADGPADCGNAPGWYYDNPANPTKIVLCQASCDAVQAEQTGKINVLFGCEPDVN